MEDNENESFLIRLLGWLLKRVSAMWTGFKRAWVPITLYLVMCASAAWTSLTDSGSEFYTRFSVQETGLLYWAILPATLTMWMIVKPLRRRTVIIESGGAGLKTTRAWWMSLILVVALAVAFVLPLGFAGSYREQPDKSHTLDPTSVCLQTLVFDTSETILATDTVNGKPGEVPNRLETAQADSLAAIEKGDVCDNFSLIRFGGTAETVLYPTNIESAIIEAINNLEISPSGSAIGEGLNQALDLCVSFAEANEVDFVCTVFVISDGAEQTEDGQITLADAQQRAADMGAVVNTVAYGSPEAVGPDGQIYRNNGAVTVYDPVAMAELAVATGGTAVEASAPGELQKALENFETKVIPGEKIDDIPQDPHVMLDIHRLLYAIAFAALCLIAVVILWKED